MLISGEASDTALRNRARYGSLVMQSGLYRARFDERDFSVQHQTLNI